MRRLSKHLYEVLSSYHQPIHGLCREECHCTCSCQSAATQLIRPEDWESSSEWVIFDVPEEPEPQVYDVMIKSSIVMNVPHCIDTAQAP